MAVNRKVTFRLYPTHREEEALRRTLRLHQQLYNAALEQRISAWRTCRHSVTFSEQCRALTALRQADPQFASLNAQSQQVTLKRVDLAFYRGEELPPVSLYKLGDAYFVLDGNHRVSVARFHGVSALDAVVTEFRAGRPGPGSEAA